MLLLVVGACSSFEDAPPGGTGSDAGTTDSETNATDAGTGSGDADAAEVVLPFDDALVARWKFDEGTGTAAIDTVTGRVATLNDGAGWAKGKIEGAFDTKGVGSATVAMHPALYLNDGEMTVAMWINAAQVPNDSFLFSYGYTFNTKLNARSPQITVGSVSDAAVGGETKANHVVPPDTWQHLAFTFKNGKAEIFVDGFVVPHDYDMPSTAALGPTTNGIIMGVGTDTTDHRLNGRMDDVRLYRRALTASEVAQLAALR